MLPRRSSGCFPTAGLATRQQSGEDREKDDSPAHISPWHPLPPGRIVWERARGRDSCFAFESTCWPGFFLYSISRCYTCFFSFLFYRREFPFQTSERKGCWELIRYLRLGEPRSCAPFTHPALTGDLLYARDELWPGRSERGGPSPCCQRMCNPVMKTPSLNSYRTLTAGLEGRIAASSVSHS